MRCTTTTFLAALAISIGPALALADDAPAEFAAGEAAFARNDYARALDHFRRAFELEPHDVVRFNIAVCYDRLGRFREAIEEYRLAAESAAVDEGARARAREQAAELRRRLGRIVFEGWPAGASVSIDGEVRCTLPCTVEEDPGPHVVIVSHAGDERVERVEVDRGGTETLTRARASEPIAARDDDAGLDLGWLAWSGIGLATVGAGLAIGFGLYAVDLHDRLEQERIRGVRNDGLADEGSLMRDLTNVFLAVAVAGAIAFVLDLWIESGE